MPVAAVSGVRSLTWVCAKSTRSSLVILESGSRSVIGFKLTLNSSENETAGIAAKLIGENVDAVVANDWSVVDRDRSRHPGEVVSAKSRESFSDLNELSAILDKKISAIKEHSHGSVS